VDGAEAKVLGAVEITWTRVLRLLEIADADTWHVGRLELEPPGEDVDLDEIAGRLEQLHFATVAPSAQVELQVAESGAEDEETAEPADSDFPF
jgi:hypothetical protein